MGTGFSLDPNEYRAAADVIQGYGSAQADNGATLAAATSTPLSGSGTGIAGAISMIAQGTVQKIVTDVTSTTQGFADDTAAGLRTQAASAEQLEADIAGHATSVLGDTGSSLSSGYGAVSGLFGTSSPQTTYGSGGAFSTSVGSPLGTNTSLGEDPLAAADSTVLGVGEPGSDGAGVATTGAPGAAGAFGAEEESQQPSAQSLGGMRSSMGGASAGAAEERGQRPDYLKSKTELTEGDKDPMKAAVDKHRQECGMAPIPFGTSRLVCAKCGSILEVGQAQTLSA
ncbi:hypothetical protein KDL01_06750 [Actinospica durhamensis]|uniref:Uncharacterized protein n=1 Tax=Actinospica durhamensis TaxID=1508375 RepID=A0A941EM87_9ACTN|nr:hypothetical protein [Actinospica durhamensis]MBR7832953.1 hypothetical protein [Actinospica durhamensis]